MGNDGRKIRVHGAIASRAHQLTFRSAGRSAASSRCRRSAGLHGFAPPSLNSWSAHYAHHLKPEKARLPVREACRVESSDRLARLDTRPRCRQTPQSFNHVSNLNRQAHWHSWHLMFPLTANEANQDQIDEEGALPAAPYSITLLILDLCGLPNLTIS